MQAYPGARPRLALVLVLVLVLVPLFINNSISYARRDTLSPVLLAPLVGEGRFANCRVCGVCGVEFATRALRSFVFCALKTTRATTLFDFILEKRSLLLVGCLWIVHCCRSGPAPWIRSLLIIGLVAVPEVRMDAPLLL